MAERNERIPEVHFYDWNAKRWLDSDARHELDPVARSIYRDCLDLCYLHGSIPKNLQVLASKCLVSEEQMEGAWPVIARHFRAHKRDSTQLVNQFANIWRKKYLLYIKSQRNRRKMGIDKAKRKKELQDGGSTTVEPPLNGGSTNIRHDKIRHDNDKKLCVCADAYDPVPGWDWFKTEYPAHRVNPAADAAAWVSIVTSQTIENRIRSRLPKFKSSQSWKKDQGRYVPAAKKFLFELMFEMEPEPEQLESQDPYRSASEIE